MKNNSCAKEQQLIAAVYLPSLTYVNVLCSFAFHSFKSYLCATCGIWILQCSALECTLKYCLTATISFLYNIRTLFLPMSPISTCILKIPPSPSPEGQLQKDTSPSTRKQPARVLLQETLPVFCVVVHWTYGQVPETDFPKCLVFVIHSWYITNLIFQWEWWKHENCWLAQECPPNFIKFSFFCTKVLNEQMAHKTRKLISAALHWPSNRGQSWACSLSAQPI